MNLREPDHLNLLCDLGELTSILTGDSDIETFLTRTTGLVAKHLKAHVCSIYLYDSTQGNLVLKATQGLNPRAVNQVKMKPGEGLVGKCFSHGKILTEGNARKNPGFKFFHNAGEEPFISFCCVPIRRGMEKTGVLVVQHREKDHFTPFDERALKTVVTQLAGAIENARLLMVLEQETDPPSQEPAVLPPFIKGESNNAGSASGRISSSSQNRKLLLMAADTSKRPLTLADFKSALDKTIADLKALQDKFAATLPESASLIFTAHFMMLKDKNFTGRMESRIAHGEPPIPVIQEIAQKYIQLFSASPHAYLKEKAVDVEDLSIRLLSNLMDATLDETRGKGSISVAQDLYPSDILKLVSDGIQGIVLVGGGLTSHVTILSRSLGIPLILTDDTRLMDLPTETRLLLDGDQGNIYINPGDDTISLFRTKEKAEQEALSYTMKEKTHTLDGRRVRLLSNINLLSETNLANDLKAEGVGLYRTEFPFLIRSNFPSEDEQFLIYKRLFDQTELLGGTTIRTLDAGGEKVLSYAGIAHEANPVLGLRSIRFALKYREVFHAQVRAILRAAHGKTNTRLMFPLISSIDEFIRAKEVVTQCTIDLEQEEIPFERDVKIGMMIELPSVLTTIDEFAELADFFAIGTNDFVQYMVGADRANKLVADLYCPYHPAVTRGIQAIARSASEHNIDVSVCGEMAHDPSLIPFLIGTGITSLSVDPQFLPTVQKTIMKIAHSDCRAYAGRLVQESRVSNAKRILDTCPGIC